MVVIDQRSPPPTHTTRRGRRGGKLLHVHVGSSRGDLIGQILQLQSEAGINPPPLAPRVRAPMRRGRITKDKNKAAA